MIHRFAWVMIFSWAVIVPDTYKTTAFVNAVAVGQTIDIENLNNVLHQQNDRLPIDQNNGDSNASNNNKETVEGEIDSKQPSAADEIENEDENENENENRNDDNLELTQKNLKNHRMTDILVACFFFVAAIWLILATVYSVILLVLLRLQARGELDIYDENLGRLVLCNGRFTIHFGCILRRYAIQLEEDYQRQLQRRFGDSSTENNQEEEPTRIRIMTREERRKAVEELLGSSSEKTVSVESRSTDDDKDLDIAECGCAGDATDALDALKRSDKTCSSPDISLSCSEEGPVCSICLVEYEPTDSVFRSKSCPHMFHKDCLFSWLERRNNTECPCCREVLISDDNIWTVVQRMRKERRTQLRKENGVFHRFVIWATSKKKTDQQQEQQRPTASSLGGDDRVDSTTSVSSGSDDEIIIIDHQEEELSSPPTEVDDDTTNSEKSSSANDDSSNNDPTSSDIVEDMGDDNDNNDEEQQ